MPDEPLSTAIQQDCLSLLTFSDEHGRIIAALVTADLFEGDYRLIAERALRFWQQHQSAPKIHIYNELEDIFSDSAHRQQTRLLRSIIVQMRDTADRANPVYVLSKLRGFIGLQRRKAAMLQMMERMNANTPLEEVDQIYSEIMRADHNIDFDSGLQLSDFRKVLKFLERRQNEFITGIPEFDKRHVVPMRSAVSLWLAATGKGKSWALTHIGYQALLARFKVLHVTLELGEEEVAQRFYQTMFRAAKRKIDNHEVWSVTRNKEGKYTGEKREDGFSQFVFSSPYVADELTSRLVQLGELNNLRIKKFPMRGLTVNKLRGFLDRLEKFDKFIPDMIILDYFGVMQTDTRDHRLSLGREFEEFKGLCDERNVAGVTAQQINKVGAQADVVSLVHVAEAWSLTNTADQVVAYSATEQEGERGLARLYIAKSRSEMDRVGVVITQDYATGQFALSSALISDDYIKKLREKRSSTGGNGNGEGNNEDTDNQAPARAGFIGLDG